MVASAYTIQRRRFGILGYTSELIWDKAAGETKKLVSNSLFAWYRGKKKCETNVLFEKDQRVGLDAKFAVNSSLNLDLTINPDFSQIDVDKHTNLTTVNLRFPERRLFFLENNDILNDFGIPPMQLFLV